MVTLKRNKRELYLCSQDVENNRKIFGHPKKYEVNYQPLTTSGFVDKPTTYDKYCTTADFYVDGEPLYFINQARFFLQRMVGDENE